MFFMYCYENKVNGKVYVGQTVQTLTARGSPSFARYNGCPKFYNALMKYGIENFDRWIFTAVDTPEQADQAEMYWIARMRQFLGEDNVYNIRDGGHKSPLSKETKEKLRFANLGKKASDETKKKLSLAHTGRKHTEESRRKMSEVQKTLDHSHLATMMADPIQKANIVAKSAASRTGLKRTEETKRKIREGVNTHEVRLAKRKGKCLPDEVMEQLIADKKNGMLTENIVTRYGVSRTSIIRSIRSYYDAIGKEFDFFEFDTSDKNKARGTKNGGAKLQEHQVIEIRKLLAEGVPMTHISKKYNVGQTTISRIKKGTHWRNVK